MVFAGLAALMNYLLNKLMYTSDAPASLFIYNSLIAMLPFLLAAVISFLVFAFSLQEEKSAVEKEPKTQETETQETEDLYR
jgi:large-conductance mechanosensitive channel